MNQPQADESLWLDGELEGEKERTRQRDTVLSARNLGRLTTGSSFFPFTKFVITVSPFSRLIFS